MGVSMGLVFSNTKIKTLKFWYPVIKAKKVNRKFAYKKLERFSYVQQGSVRNMFSIKDNVFIHEADDYGSNGEWALGERGYVSYITNDELRKFVSRVDHALVEIVGIKFLTHKVELLCDTVSELDDLSDNFNCRTYKALVDSLTYFYEEKSLKCPLKLISEVNYFDRRVKLSSTGKDKVISFYRDVIEPISDDELLVHETIIKDFIETISSELRPEYRQYFFKLIDVLKNKKTTLVLDYNY